MPMKVSDATVSTFDTVFQKFISEAPKNKANLILFLADEDPSTSLSWCPDCVRAEPVIYKKLETSSDDVALLRAFVGDRPTWRNPQHPWRVDSRFKLTGVPTLVLWQNDAIQGRLEDHEAHIENKIDALVYGSRLEDHEAHIENKIDALVSGSQLEDHEAHIENKMDAPVSGN